MEDLMSLNNEAAVLDVAQNGERLLTVKEMAAFLQITTGALKDWTKLEEDPCPCYRFKSRVLRFDKNEVLTWFRNQTQKKSEACNGELREDLDKEIEELDAEDPFDDDLDLDEENC